MPSRFNGERVLSINACLNVNHKTEMCKIHPVVYMDINVHPYFMSFDRLLQEPGCDFSEHMHEVTG